NQISFGKNEIGQCIGDNLPERYWWLPDFNPKSHDFCALRWFFVDCLPDSGIQIYTLDSSYSLGIHEDVINLVFKHFTLPNRLPDFPGDKGIVQKWVAFA